VNPYRDIERTRDHFETVDVLAFYDNEASGGINVDGLQRYAGVAQPIYEMRFANLSFEIVGLTFNDFNKTKIAL
jgi:hypothetical protein